jgi:hypothetical protein
LTRRFDIGPILLALGAALLLVALFLKWYGPLTAWNAFELTDILLAALAVAAWAAPSLVQRVRGVLDEAVGSLGRGLRVLVSWRTAAVVAGGVVLVTAAYRVRPRFEVDLGSGREAAVAEGFGAYDSDAGVSYRQPLRGACLDLRDFGGGAPWTITLTAALSPPRAGEPNEAAIGRPRGGEPVGGQSRMNGPRLVVLARAGDAELVAPLGERWATPVFRAASPWGWRSGLALTFPSGGDPPGVRVDRVDVDRGRSFPSLRVTAAVTGAALLAAVALAAAGLGAATAFAAAGLTLAAQALALAIDPVTTVPFAVPFLVITLAGAALAALLAGAAGGVMLLGGRALSMRVDPRPCWDKNDCTL